MMAACDMQEHFIIRWESRDKSVFLWPASEVSIRLPSDENPDERGRRVVFRTGQNEQKTIETGKVYIMNAAGKTVETVCLS